MSGGGESKTTAQLDCEVCCETFTKTTHKKITCGQCELVACRKCVRVYLMNSTTKAHCMKCKSEWDREITQQNIGKSYFNKEYNNHRKEVLFETEKARFPETMPLVVRYRNFERWYVLACHEKYGNIYDQLNWSAIHFWFRFSYFIL